MKRLFLVSVIAGLLVAAASLSYAESKIKSTKSNTSDRVGEAATPSGAVQGKDPCGDYKNNTNRYGACQKAARLGSSQVGGGQGQKASVCSGGYWWTGGWGGWTQGGSCSPEGAIK